jgi:hypothetical protein
MFDFISPATSVGLGVLIYSQFTDEETKLT